MSLWALFRNIGVVLAFFKSFKGLISEVAATRKTPSVESVVLLIENARVLLDSGAIDIPGVDEHEISDALKQIKEQLCSK